MRIVSLLASATEIVCRLGLQDQLVAISHECDYPPEVLDRPRISRPRFDPGGLDSGEIDAAVRAAMSRYGSVYQLDANRLRDLEPDLILAQAVCEVCAVPTSLAKEASQILDGRPVILSLDCHTVEDVLEGVRAVGEAASVPDRAEVCVAELRARIEAVGDRVAGGPRLRVLALEWLDPPFVPGHWTPGMIGLAGGEGLLGRGQVPSHQVTWQELERTDPDVLVVMPCGYGLAAAVVDADRHAEELALVAPRAIAAGRAYVVDGSAYFNRSGPRMVDGIEILSALLHPDRVGDHDLVGRAERWAPAPLGQVRGGAGAAG